MSWNWENMLLLDRMNDFGQPDPMYAFALDELLCRSAGKGGPAICHLWRHPHAFVMGLRDSRMPYAREARQWLESSGWRVIVRNSGGAAVPLDAGVVNVSLILPKANAMELHFHNDFERMYGLIARALQGTGRTVEKGEISGAFCPGDFDLSIDGYKFCGIAQRRQTHASIVQAFVVAEGSGRARAEFVRSFYEIASGGNDTLGHPIVAGDSTASLEELAGLGPQGAHAFATEVKKTIRDGQTAEGVAEASSRLVMPSAEQINAMIESLRTRYENAE
ncbi:lipoate--protein ligase family protein [Paenibacillus sp. LHD-117]|uniref:lipoate--protein ligase family protein n=1 Tax=Paenibacillus sp. LHD-117 TaxID=3071412 RepID=UPI0027E10693|nr:lipoate--protein ligase family protein [Paenibacillus sp. LHD-117]MDQ6422824.1 lipoate--protein ligase family protein [Paenibacillus sp. LHD-117]